MRRTLLFAVAFLSTPLLAADAAAKRNPLPSGELSYTAPKEWKAERPSDSMRKAQFRLPAAEGAEEGLLTVCFFHKTGGGVDKNIQRWSGQFRNPDGSAVTKPTERKAWSVGEIPVTRVYYVGTYLESMSSAMMGVPVKERPDYAMLGAIAETAEGPWFFKATGPKATIDRWKEPFDRFLDTLSVKK